MDTTRSKGTGGIIGHAVRLTMSVAREERDLRRAVRHMPKPVPWDWAAPRLVPVLAGPIMDPPGESLVRVHSDLGPMVEIGLDLGSAMTYVDARVAERWECSPDQLMERALQNLRERAARIAIDRVQTGVFSGRAVRILRERPRWASSVLLSTDELFRLFGGHDQVVAAPTTDCLLSFSIDTPPVTIADIVVSFEQGSRRPLWLDPFLVSDGRLTWAEPIDTDDDWETS
jgi:hypothetical protein